jgi:hypothetical protein
MKSLRKHSKYHESYATQRTKDARYTRKDLIEFMEWVVAISAVMLAIVLAAKHINLIT